MYRPNGSLLLSTLLASSTHTYPYPTPLAMAARVNTPTTPAAHRHPAGRHYAPDHLLPLRPETPAPPQSQVPPRTALNASPSPPRCSSSPPLHRRHRLLRPHVPKQAPLTPILAGRHDCLFRLRRNGARVDVQRTATMSTRHRDFFLGVGC